jgi:puromycin-sensitive aminopeptidase
VAAAAVSIVAGVGSEDEWERYAERFRTTDSPQESLRYLYALAGFPSVALAERTLAMTVGEIRTQNAPFVIFHLLTNRHVQTVAWEFVKREWDQLCERSPTTRSPACWAAS